MKDQPTPTWRLLDLATGGRAEEVLAWKRAEGSDYRTIAADLARDYGIHVSREWVRLRCVALGIEKPEAYRSTA